MVKHYCDICGEIMTPQEVQMIHTECVSEIMDMAGVIDACQVCAGKITRLDLSDAIKTAINKMTWVRNEDMCSEGYRDD